MFAGVQDTYETVGDAGLAAALINLERRRRSLDAEMALVVDIAARQHAYRADGHRSVRGWVKALINCTNSDAAALTQLGRLLRDVPEAGHQLFEAEVGTSQVRELARLRRNPRCGHELPDDAALLLEHAATLEFEDFKQCTRDWELRHDPDGAFKDREHNHQRRNASVLGSEEGAHIRADGGTSAVAAEMMEIFRAFCHAEFLADWDSAVHEHGDLANKSHMARTDAQRRFDALAAIFRAAATAPLDGRVSQPVVNFMIDPDTLEQYINWRNGDSAPSRTFHATSCGSPSRSSDAAGSDHRSRRSGDPVSYRGFQYTPGWDREYWYDPSLCPETPTIINGRQPTVPDDVGSRAEQVRNDGFVGGPNRGGGQPRRHSRDPRHWRCETVNGIPVHPEDVVDAALAGHIRRVLLDSAGNVIDLGRRRRLFTGSAKEAIHLQSRRCVWPGCDVPTTACEADHSQPWAQGGSTAPTNGAPLCSHHNRVKNDGFTTRRDDEGRWHTYRSDGSELNEPPKVESESSRAA